MRGYFGIGIEHTKSEVNVGTLWRTAQIMGASFVFTIGRRYKRQAADTMNTAKHVPLYHYITFDDFYKHMPKDCRLVGIELDSAAAPIRELVHPERCIYLLGAEDHGLRKETMQKCHKLVRLPGKTSLNVAVAGSLVIFDRITKLGI